MALHPAAAEALRSHHWEKLYREEGNTVPAYIATLKRKHEQVLMPTATTTTSAT